MLRPWTILLLSLAWAQSLESANSYIGFILGGTLPSGSSAAKSFTYPTHGYLNNGAALGLQVTTFIAPYLSLNLRLSQSFLPMDSKAIHKRGHLFPEPVQIEKNPQLSHTTIGFGVGTGARWDFLSAYIPLYFAIGAYAAPEIQGLVNPNRTWVQEKHSTIQVGLSTGLILNFHVIENFPIGLSILYTSLRSNDKPFERKRYDRGNIDRTFLYRAPIRTDLTEVGLLIGYEF